MEEGNKRETFFQLISVHLFDHSGHECPGTVLELGREQWAHVDRPCFVNFHSSAEADNTQVHNKHLNSWDTLGEKYKREVGQRVTEGAAMRRGWEGHCLRS